MYKAARPEKKKIVGGLLLSAALTSMITGITEPLEFTFLFVAPVMYAVHFVLAGFNFKTPGRETDDEETKLYTRQDMNNKKKAAAATKDGFDRVSALILKGLGGKSNLSDVDCCATRLRITKAGYKTTTPMIICNTGDYGSVGTVASGIISAGDKIIEIK